MVADFSSETRDQKKGAWPAQLVEHMTRSQGYEFEPDIGGRVYFKEGEREGDQKTMEGLKVLEDKNCQFRILYPEKNIL